jgi:hypothetical protein
MTKENTELGFFGPLKPDIPQIVANFIENIINIEDASTPKIF